MTGINFYTDEERSRIVQTMSPEQVKVLRQFGRLLWVSFNITLQFMQADDWIFEGTETDPHYQRGRIHEGYSLKCDICGYHPIKDSYVLSSLSKNKSISLGKKCFEDEIRLSGKVKKEIMERKNEVDIYRDSIIRLYAVGQRFPEERYQQARKSPDYPQIASSNFARRIEEFRRVDLPLYSRDEAQLRRYALSVEKKGVKKTVNIERKQSISSAKLNALNSFIVYRFQYLQNDMERLFSSSGWEFIEDLHGTFNGSVPVAGKCVCGQDAQHLLELKNKYNESVLFLNPYHVLRHSVLDQKSGEELIKLMVQVDDDWTAVVKGAEKNLDFPEKEFQIALSHGFFNADKRAEFLDYCELLEDVNLPLPPRYYEPLREFSEKYNDSLNAPIKAVINCYQMLEGTVESFMPDRKKVIDVAKAISEYASYKAKISLPAADENRVLDLPYEEKQSQLLYYKILLYTFYRAVEDYLSDKIDQGVKGVIDLFIEDDLQRVSEKDLQQLKDYLKWFEEVAPMQDITKIQLDSENFSFFSPPKRGEEVGQVLTIFADGRVDFSAGTSTEEVRHIEKQVDASTAETVLGMVAEKFQQPDDQMDFATDVGTWQLTISYPDRNAKFTGSVFPNPRLSDVSDTIRKVTAIPDLWVFDGIQLY